MRLCAPDCRQSVTEAKAFLEKREKRLFIILPIKFIVKTWKNSFTTLKKVKRFYGF